MKKEIVIDGKTYVLKEETRKSPEFKEGEWVKGFGGRGRINTIYQDGEISVIDVDGKISKYREDQLRKMSSSEIETHLIAEAKRRGYKEGVVFKNLESGKQQEITQNNHYYDNDSTIDGLCCGCTNERDWDIKGCHSNAYIYLNGKWAEIIKEEPIKIGGYEVEFKKGEIKVGCKTIDNEELLAIERVAELICALDVNLTIQGNGNIHINHNLDRDGNIDTNLKDLTEKIINKLQD